MIPGFLYHGAKSHPLPFPSAAWPETKPSAFAAACIPFPYPKCCGGGIASHDGSCRAEECHPLPPARTKRSVHRSHLADHLGELLPAGFRAAGTVTPCLTLSWYHARTSPEVTHVERGSGTPARSSTCLKPGGFHQDLPRMHVKTINRLI